MDFPFELLLDCLVYGVLAEDSNLDGKLDKTEKIFLTYMQMNCVEVREIILRKLW